MPVPGVEVVMPAEHSDSELADVLGKTNIDLSDGGYCKIYEPWRKP